MIAVIYAEGAHQHVFVCVNVMLARYMILSPTTTRKRTTLVRKQINIVCARKRMC